VKPGDKVRIKNSDSDLDGTLVEITTAHVDPGSPEFEVKILERPQHPSIWKQDDVVYAGRDELEPVLPD
jgi:hypothetical protein